MKKETCDIEITTTGTNNEDAEKYHTSEPTGFKGFVIQEMETGELSALKVKSEETVMIPIFDDLDSTRKYLERQKKFKPRDDYSIRKVEIKFLS